MDISYEYLAGVADSDGSFSYIKQKLKSGRYHYRPFFQLTWKDSKEARAVMQSCIDNYGANFYEGKTKPTAFNSNGCDIIKIQMWGTALKKFTENILPHLIIKKKQAMLILEATNLKSRHWGSRGKPEYVLTREEELHQLMNKINTKNKKHA